LKLVVSGQLGSYSPINPSATPDIVLFAGLFLQFYFECLLAVGDVTLVTGEIDEGIVVACFLAGESFLEIEVLAARACMGSLRHGQHSGGLCGTARRCDSCPKTAAEAEETVGLDFHSGLVVQSLAIKINFHHTLKEDE
jgi:hypothetical protein